MTHIQGKAQDIGIEMIKIAARRLMESGPTTAQQKASTVIPLKGPLRFIFSKFVYLFSVFPLSFRGGRSPPWNLTTILSAPYQSTLKLIPVPFSYLSLSRPRHCEFLNLPKQSGWLRYISTRMKISACPSFSSPFLPN
jgi:hypothetical protein